MSLQEKTLHLQLTAVLAARHAAFWNKMIAEHGEEKATAFYCSLGLNHLEKKSYEWEGLTLSREPKEHEKLCLKSIADAQEAGKESVGKILLESRTELIESGMIQIRKLSPSTYHELVLTVSKELNEQLREQLTKIFNKGRRLVSQELGKKADDFEDDDAEELDTLTELTDARVANEVQSRITSATTKFALLGLVGVALYNAVQSEVTAGSVTYIDRAARGVSGKVLAFGRSREAERRNDEWDRVEYSAILDQNVCEPCAAEDGTTASNENDLAPAPNPECVGGDMCRCFHVWLNQ